MVSLKCACAVLPNVKLAAAERIFSLLKVSFGNTQALALQDYIETSLMLQFNSRIFIENN